MRKFIGRRMIVPVLFVAAALSAIPGWSESPSPPPRKMEFVVRSGGEVKVAVPEAKSFLVFLPLPNDVAWRIEKLRHNFRFESLTKRLQALKQPERGEVKLGPAAAARLEADDGNRHSRRTDALQVLHSSEVEEFVNRPGMGLSRMFNPKPSTEDLQYGKPAPMEFVKLSPLSSEEDSLPAAPLGAATVASVQVPRLITPLIAEYFHHQNRENFANVNGFGYVRDVENVAGFQSHAFSLMPRLTVRSRTVAGTKAPVSQISENFIYHHYDGTPVSPMVTPPGAERWLVARLELVSLLKHETPRVYLSEHLPRMDELRNAPTRELDSFEARALAQLHNGEEVQTSATPNRIVMLGAVRASKQCLQCHEVPRGTLLGAFSYELRRDPPIAIKTNGDAVQ